MLFMFDSVITATLLQVCSFFGFSISDPSCCCWSWVLPLFSRPIK
nr:hypothetical protein Iba_chr11fCG13340 [Ipomoea batatas]